MIACEHCLWAAQDGQSPRDVLSMIGLDWPAHKIATWDDAMMGLEWAWRRIAAPERDEERRWAA